MNIETQLKTLYIFETSICLRIADAVWVLFLLQRGFSLAQIGIAEGIFHITSMLCEVPSGMAADLFGRKRTLVFSGLLGMASSLFMCMDAGFSSVCAGMAFSALSYNLISGTEEALLYDSLLLAGQKERFGKALSVISMIGRTGAALGCLLSPGAVALGYRGTYMVSMGLYLVSSIAAIKLTEPLVTDRQKNARKIRGQVLEGALAAISGKVFRFMAGHPKIILKLFCNGAIGCPVYLTVMFLQGAFDSKGLAGGMDRIPLLVMRLSGTAGVWLSIRGLGAGLAGNLMVCGLISGLGAFMAGSSWIPAIIFGAMLIQASEGFAEIRVNENVNRDFQSDQRATMVSIDSMLYSVLMIVVSPVMGKISDLYGTRAGFSLLGVSLAAGSLSGGGIWFLYRYKSAAKGGNL